MARVLGLLAVLPGLAAPTSLYATLRTTGETYDLDAATYDAAPEASRRLAPGPPVLNMTGVRLGRMNYTYFSPKPFSFRESRNPWVLLGSTLTVYDKSSDTIAAAYFHFDPAHYDGDALFYNNAVAGIRGSYDHGSRALVLTGAASKADWQLALRSVMYKAKESLSKKDDPNVHQRLVWISLEDDDGNRGASFGINITLQTANTIITDRNGAVMKR